MACDLETEVVLVRAHTAVLQCHILLKVFAEQLFHGLLVELTFILNVNRFLLIADEGIALQKDGDKSAEKDFSFLIDRRTQFRKLHVINAQGFPIIGPVGGEILQEGITLTQDLSVIDETVQVNRVALRDDAVQKFPSGLAAFNDKVAVSRGNDDGGNKADMFAELVIGFIISLDHLFLSTFCAYHYLLLPFLFKEFTFHHKKICIVVDVLGGDGVEITFTESQMVYAVQHIGFPHPIVPYDTIDLGVKFQICRFYILVIEKGEGFQK